MKSSDSDEVEEVRREAAKADCGEGTTTRATKADAARRRSARMATDFPNKRAESQRMLTQHMIGVAGLKKGYLSSSPD